MPISYHRDERQFFALPGQILKDWYDNRLLPNERQGEWTPEPEAIEGEEEFQQHRMNDWPWGGGWLNGVGVPYQSREIEEIRTAHERPFWSHIPHNGPDVYQFERFRMSLQLPPPEYMRYRDGLPWEEYDQDMSRGSGVIRYPGGGLLSFDDCRRVPKALWLTGPDSGRSVTDSDLREFRNVCDRNGEFMIRDIEENMSITQGELQRYSPPVTRRVRIVRLQLPASAIQFNSSDLFLLMESR